jgi:hypothetical protein
VLGRTVGVGQVVEQPQLFLEQERAVEPLVGRRDCGQASELLRGLSFGSLEQRPTGVLDPPSAFGLALAVLVPAGAADVVHGAAGELAYVEGIEHDLGAELLVALGDRGDRILVAGGHVDRDRLDRVASLAEHVEERQQGGGVAAGLGPHDRAALVVGHAGQVPLPEPVADLIHAEENEPIEPRLAEVMATTRVTMSPTESHAIRINRRIGGLASC